MEQQQWLSALSGLRLSAAEEEAVKRYRDDPYGRGFLPVADILRNHKKLDASLAILTDGLENHETFTQARVALARELLARGLVAKALVTLEDSPTPLDDEALAQKLRFKLAVLANMESQARAIAEFLEQQHMLDEEMVVLINFMNSYQFAGLRSRLLQDYEAKGTKLQIPEPGDFEELLASRPARTPRQQPVRQETLSEGFGYARDPALYNFHVVPLQQVFSGEMLNLLDGDRRANGLELDSTTLADLYAQQGHLHKASAIYRRLLSMSPANEFLQRRLQELTAMEKEQPAGEAPPLEAAIVDKMETVEIIDTQMHFLNHMLNQLSR
jgi:hypothetical protein